MLPCGSAAEAPNKTSAPPCKSIFEKPDSTSLPMSSCDMPSFSEANAARKTSKVASQARRISSSSCGDFRGKVQLLAQPSFFKPRHDHNGIALARQHQCE